MGELGKTSFKAVLQAAAGQKGTRMRRSSCRLLGPWVQGGMYAADSPQRRAGLAEAPTQMNMLEPNNDMAAEELSSLQGGRLLTYATPPCKLNDSSCSLMQAAAGRGLHG